MASSSSSSTASSSSASATGATPTPAPTPTESEEEKQAALFHDAWCLKDGSETRAVGERLRKIANESKISPHMRFFCIASRDGISHATMKNPFTVPWNEQGIQAAVLRVTGTFCKELEKIGKSFSCAACGQNLADASQLTAITTINHCFTFYAMSCPNNIMCSMCIDAKMRVIFSNRLDFTAALTPARHEADVVASMPPLK